jgi:hypothetical protein
MKLPRTRAPVRPLAFAFVVLTAGMFASQSGCGSKGDPGALGEVGTYDGDASGAFLGGDASAPGAFDAHIEENHVTITFVTVSCAGDCADVEAVATGGHPPYAFAWDDGSTSATRRVCPKSNTAYDVKVTDTGSTGEFAQAAQTVQVPLPAKVLACPDGGAADAGGNLCLSNPSLEGTAGATIEQIDAPPWLSCLLGLSYANIWNASLADGIVPSDGNTYLRLGSVGSQSTLSSASEPICAPMEAGSTYHVLLDMAYEPQDSTAPSSLQIWGGASSCSLGELLWTSDPVTATSWKTYCATLTPSKETTYLTLGARVPASLLGNTSGLYIDHMVPVAACP